MILDSGLLFLGHPVYTVSQNTGHAYYVSQLFEKSNSIIDIWHK